MVLPFQIGEACTGVATEMSAHCPRAAKRVEVIPALEPRRSAPRPRKALPWLLVVDRYSDSLGDLESGAIMAKPDSESTSYPDAIILCGRALASRTSCISLPHRVQDAALWAHLLHTFATLRCIYSWGFPLTRLSSSMSTRSPPRCFPVRL